MILDFFYSGAIEKNGSISSSEKSLGGFKSNVPFMNRIDNLFYSISEYTKSNGLDTHRCLFLTNISENETAKNVVIFHESVNDLFELKIGVKRPLHDGSVPKIRVESDIPNVEFYDFLVVRSKSKYKIVSDYLPSLDDYVSLLNVGIELTHNPVNKRDFYDQVIHNFVNDSVYNLMYSEESDCIEIVSKEILPLNFVPQYFCSNSACQFEVTQFSGGINGSVGIGDIPPKSSVGVWIKRVFNTSVKIDLDDLLLKFEKNDFQNVEVFNKNIIHSLSVLYE